MEKPDFIRLLLGDITFDDLDDGWYDRCIHQDYSRKTKREYTRAAKDYLKVFLDVCSNRRLFVTEKGSFGIGPAETEKGDLVWVLEGARVPYILRTRRNDKEGSSTVKPDFDRAHTFIGEAVVRGIMYATKESLLQDEESGRIRVRKISLR